MTDPGLIGSVAAFGVSVGSNVAAAAVVDVVKSAARKLGATNGWDDLDTQGRMFRLLAASHDGRSSTVTTDRMETVWRADPSFAEAYQRFVVAPEEDVDAAAFRDAIAPLLTDLQRDDARAVAEDLALALPYCFLEAARGTELHQHRAARLEWQVERLGNRLATLMQEQSAPVVMLPADWPGAPEELLRQAAEEDPDGVKAVTEALDRPDADAELGRLIRRPRPWMNSLKQSTWGLLASRAARSGQWQEAKSAWCVAAARPGADVAGYTCRASEAARHIPDEVQAEVLLNEARAEQPAHPRVLFNDAIERRAPEDVLAGLALVGEADPDTTVHVHLARASAYVDLDRIEDAEESLRAVEASGGAKSPAYQFVLLRLRLQAVLADPAPDAQAATRWAAECIELEEVLRERHLVEQAASARSHAVGFLANVGDHEGIRVLLDESVPLYSSASESVRMTMAVTASQLGHRTATQGLYRTTDGSQDALLVAAWLESTDSEVDPAVALGSLEELLDSDAPRLVLLAALRILELQSSQANADSWSDRAYEAVLAYDEHAAVLMRTYWLENTDRFDQAVRELLQRSGEAWAVDELMRLHARAQDWPQAAKYARQALSGPRDWATRLMAAEALRTADTQEDADDPQGVSEAFAVFEALAEDEGAPVHVRRVAYERVISEAVRRWQFPEAGELAASWLKIDPDNSDPAWVRVRSLAYAGHDADAVAAAQEYQLIPRLSDEAALLGRLLPVVWEPNAAAERLLELAEQVPDHAEELTAAALLAVLRAGDDVSPEVLAKASFEDFFATYPDSTRFRPIRTEDFIRDFVEPGGSVRQQHDRSVALAHDIVYGTDPAPTAVAAQALGIEHSEFWRRMANDTGLPLGFSNAALHENEVESASKAIGSPVLFDPSSLFVVASLADHVADRIRNVFPGAHVTVSALAAIAETARDVNGVAQSAGQGPQDGGPPQPRAPWAGGAAVLRLAQTLQAVPDRDPASPQPEDELVEPDESALFGLVGVFSATKRLGLPLFSDDRDLRRRFRLMGQEAFGTLALLDALVQTKHISEDARDEARTALGKLRGLGLRPSVDDLAGHARASNWRLCTPLVDNALDGWAWRGGITDTAFLWVGFLRLVFDEAPDQFPAWCARVLDAAHRGIEVFPTAELAAMMLAPALVPVGDTARAFFRALSYEFERALRNIPGPPRHDPVDLEAFRTFVQVTNQYPGPPGTARFVVLRALTMLPLETSQRVAADWLGRIYHAQRAQVAGA